MNRKIIAVAMLIFSAMMLLGGCINMSGRRVVYGTGAMVSRSLSGGNFTELEIGGGASFTVVFKQSDDISVHVEMQKNLFDLHKMSISRGALSITRTNNNTIIYGDYRPRVYISAPYLTAINVGGALHTEDWDAIRTPSFSITSNGFVGMAAPLEVDTLQLHLSGASEIEFWGDAQNVVITKNGAGSILARGLQTKDAVITLNGAGDIEIAVSDTLDATLAGVGNIRYIGNPTVTQNRSGLGSIRRME